MNPKPSAGKQNCPLVRSSLMINALIWLLLAITMRPTEGITTAPPTQLQLQLQLQHAKSNYHDPSTEALEGLAGYTRNFYSTLPVSAAGGPLDNGDGGGGGAGGDLASAAYANYDAKTNSGHFAVAGLGSTLSGFVPTTSNYAPQQQYSNKLQHEYGQGKIDFTINTANYDSNADRLTYEDPNDSQADGDIVAEEHLNYYNTAPAYQIYQARAPHSRDYNIEQFSNYHRAVSDKDQLQRASSIQQRHQPNDASRATYAHIEQRQALLNQVKRQEQQQSSTQSHYYHYPTDAQAHRPQSRTQYEDQQLLYSHAESSNALPPITRSVHHTAASSKAIAGLPLSKHIEITKHVPITHYHRQHVPYKQTVQVHVPRAIITAVPRPMPIKVPVSKTVAVPQLQEVKIPIEKVKPVAVERPVPFVVERRVPYRVEKPVATPFYYPYPVKVPVVRTIVHKQLPAHASLPPRAHYPLQVTPGGWNTANSLLG